ncbi:MAG: hypothetical protein RhofKO_32090 [Rhodothermales bacterium]
MPPIEMQPTAADDPEIVAGGSKLQARSFIVGRNPNPVDIDMRLYGFTFRQPPTQVLVQPRVEDNYADTWGDQFAVLVISVAADHVRVKIRRVDGGGGPAPWAGLNLRLDVLAVGR